MLIREIQEEKKRYLDLLLLADEQEEMIDRYLDSCHLYVLEEQNDTLAVCAVQEQGDGIIEVKNLAVKPSCQKRGLGRMMLSFVEKTFAFSHHLILVGTGESPLTLPFYEKCGYTLHHRVKGFFLRNYDHEIWEDGVRLEDMVYLAKRIGRHQPSVHSF